MADTARIEELRRRVQTDPASIAFAALAEEYRRAGQFDDAIATCRTGLQRHPAYLSARVTLGRSLLETDRYDEARQELEQVLRAAPENLAAIRALAEIHHRVGELPETDHQFPTTETPPVAGVSAAAAQLAVLVAPPLVAAPAAQQAAPATPQAAAPVAPQVAVPIPPQAAAPKPQQAPVPIPIRSAPPVSPPAATPALINPPAVARPPAPRPRQPHSDEVALPALEVFLSAIVAARTSGNRVSN
jgi:tetratricopeptide (TPR) repeat protein